MDKNIGFRRSIYLDWLEAAAALRLTTGELPAIREELSTLVGQRVHNVDARRIAVDILVNIWVKSAARHPSLHATALELYRTSPADADRLWLHYGMSLLAYDFFRECVTVVGQISRSEERFTPADVKRAMIAGRGALGGLEQAVERVLFSLRNWGILQTTEVRYTYAPVRRGFGATQRRLELWMLAVLLETHPGEELAFGDLMRRPELFPFRLQVTVDEVRQHPWFVLERQGAGIEMVRLGGEARRIVNSQQSTVNSQ